MKKILLLHGALGSAQQLEPLHQALANQFDVYAFNFEGHGGRPSEEPFSIALFTQNTLQFLQQKDISTISIFGYSMGGYVALHLAKDHPQLVDKIITLGTKFDWSLDSAQREVKMLNPDKIEAKVPAFAQQLAQRHSPNDWKVLLHKTADMMLNMAKGAKLQEQDLQNISTPTLVCIGGADKMVSQAESQEAAAILPNGKLEVVEGFPHPIEKVEVERLAGLIKGFI
ncbi:MAG: alpha/beta hydrolase [Bacteroidota bacterium]